MLLNFFSYLQSEMALWSCGCWWSLWGPGVWTQQIFPRISSTRLSSRFPLVPDRPSSNYYCHDVYLWKLNWFKPYFAESSQTKVKMISSTSSHVTAEQPLLQCISSRTQAWRTLRLSTAPILRWSGPTFLTSKMPLSMLLALQQHHHPTLQDCRMCT